MRKNDLIKLLENIKGNPEVVLWNGFVQDWQAISPRVETVKLVKHSRKHYEDGIRNEIIAHAYRNGYAPEFDEQLDVVEPALKHFNEQTWDFPNRFIESNEEFKEWYGNHTKNVVILEPLERNKETFDRLGTINY